MGGHKVKIGILTSSRADYGIYLPLLRVLQYDPYFDLNIIAFGTHLSKKYGHTIDGIIKDGFSVNYKISTVSDTDTPIEISKSMGFTISKFAEFYANNHFDIILALGDRYEMFAAVTASVPFNIKVGHIHGGETTTGAIDNSLRHSITSMSYLHFTSNKEHSSRVEEIIGSNNHIFNVGALGLDNIKNISLLDNIEFYNQFGIDLSVPSILTTFHPETINIISNKSYARISSEVVKELSEKYQMIITMPNADTFGSYFRMEFAKLSSTRNICLVENFGTIGYFTCLQESLLVLGNSSSGIIEAASFGKYFVNVGNRQRGRITSKNVKHVPFEKKKIISEVNSTIALGNYNGKNIYYQGGASNLIVNKLKNEIDKLKRY